MSLALSLRAMARAKLLSKDEARRITANIAKLPDLLRQESQFTDQSQAPAQRSAWLDHPGMACSARTMALASRPAF
jgi:hypothetical protein